MFEKIKKDAFRLWKQRTVIFCYIFFWQKANLAYKKG